MHIRLKNISLLLSVYLFLSFSSLVQSEQSKTRPKFINHKTKIQNIFNQNVSLNLNDKRNRQFKSVLSGFLTESPNFSGKYVLATWGCGSSCQRHAIVNKLNGDVFWPKEIESSVTLFTCEKEPLEFKPSSNLLVVNKPSFDGNVVQSFYVWKRNRLLLISRLEIEESEFCEQDKNV